MILTQPYNYVYSSGILGEGLLGLDLDEGLRGSTECHVRSFAASDLELAGVTRDADHPLLVELRTGAKESGELLLRPERRVVVLGSCQGAVQASGHDLARVGDLEGRATLHTVLGPELRPVDIRKAPTTRRSFGTVSSDAGQQVLALHLVLGQLNLADTYLEDDARSGGTLALRDRDDSGNAASSSHASRPDSCLTIPYRTAAAIAMPSSDQGA